MSEWVNRLDFSQRAIVIQMYVNGITISAITRMYQVHHSSVRYHLKKAGVYVKNKRGVLNIKDIERKNHTTTLDYFNTKGQKFKVAIFPYRIKDVGWPEHERKFPLSYKDYVQREANRNSILLKNGIQNLRIKLTNTDNDPDFFQFPRRKRSPTYIAKTREKIKGPVAYSIVLEDSLPVEDLK